MRSLRDAALMAAAALLGLFLANAGRGADPDPKAKAAAALALAQAQRTREHVVADAAGGCYDDADYKVAVRFAEKNGKPLVLWVGMKCADRPELRKALAEAVHCHLKDYASDDTPRLVVQAADGTDYIVRREKITDGTAAKIKAKWAETKGPPARPGVRVSEELSRKASPCSKCADKAGGCDCNVGGCACEAQAAQERRAKLLSAPVRTRMLDQRTGAVWFLDRTLADYLAAGNSVDAVQNAHGWLTDDDKALLKAARPAAVVHVVAQPPPEPARTFSAGFSYAGPNVQFKAGASGGT